MSQLILYIAAIFIFAGIGAALPFVKRWNDTVLHSFIAFGAGVFLGAVFFHLLPDISPVKGGFILVLIGFLFVLLIEQFTARRHDTDSGDDVHRHDVISIATFTGLVIHSLTAGLALGIGTYASVQLGFVMFIAIIAHKAVGAFSLATILRLSSFSTRKSITLLVIFALMTPFGAILAYLLLSDLGTIATQISLALATGTFLYVTTMDLLPEAYHIKARRLQATLLMFLGLLVMLAISLAGA